MNNKSLKKTLLLLLVCMGGFHLYAQFKQPMINLEHLMKNAFSGVIILVLILLILKSITKS